jgi:hypothetical protein
MTRTFATIALQGARTCFGDMEKLCYNPALTWEDRPIEAIDEETGEPV